MRLQLTLLSPEKNAWRDSLSPKIICLAWCRQFQERETTALHNSTNFLSPKPLPCSKGSQPAHPPAPPERGCPHCVCAKTVSSAKVRLSSLSVLCLQTLTIFISVTDFIPFWKPFLKIQSGGPFWYSNRNSFSHSSAGWKSKIKTRLIFCIHLE